VPRRVPGIAALAAMGMVVVPSLLVAFSLRASEEAEVDARLDRAATDVSVTLVRELDRLADLGADLAIATTMLDAVDAGSYAALLDRFALDERFPSLTGITYVECVPRAQIEQQLRLREGGGPPLELREDAGGDVVRVATMSYPLERNRAVLGVDLTSRPESASAHDRALRTGQPALSDLTRIVQLRLDEPGAVLHVPVVDDGPPTASLGMVLSVEQLFQGLDPLPSGIEIRLVDPGSPVFPTAAVLSAEGPLLDRAASAPAPGHGQEWTVEVTATPGFVQPLLRRGSTLLGLGGVVAGLLVGLLVSALSSRERHATALVAERTAEVRTANAELAATNLELAAANNQLELADRNKDDFLAAVSHELRTPLTVISGFVESLRRLRPTGDELEDLLQPIERNVHRLDGLVADLLTLVSLDAGALVPHPEPVRLADVMARVARELAGLPSEVVLVQVEGDPVAMVDRGHLERMLVNLLTNADRHGEPPIEVAARQRDEGFVELAVRDHGAGIPEDEAEVVFERFTRAPSTQAVVGTGLGLTIVRELATLGGGGVVYSSAQPGARFTVWMPAADQLTAVDGALPAVRPARSPC
jgi:signal transduction histidine kinase